MIRTKAFVLLRLEYKALAFLNLVASIQLSHQTGTSGTLTGRRCTLYEFTNKHVHVVYIKIT